jgi:predicted Zn finger-like uncharacterized protein
MSVVLTCPECGGQLRARDEQLGKKVRCPKCKEVFTAESEEDPEAFEEPEEEEEAPRRPAVRSRRRDEDDRPRQRRAREEGEEDEEEDRPRKRRGRYEDEEPRRRQERDPRRERAWAGLSILLMLIGTAVNLGALLLLLLLTSLAVLGGILSDNWVMLLLVGLPGLGGMMTFTVGAGFSLLGPWKWGGLGFSIATLVLTGMQLLLLLSALIPQDVAVGFGPPLRASIDWQRFASALPVFNAVGLHLLASSGRGGIGLDVVLLFTGLFEAVRLVLAALWLRSVEQTSTKLGAGGGWLLAVIAAGSSPAVLMLLGILFGVIYRNMTVQSLSSLRALFFTHTVLVILLSAAALGAFLFALLGGRGALSRRR